MPSKPHDRSAMPGAHEGSAHEGSDIPAALAMPGASTHDASAMRDRSDRSDPAIEAARPDRSNPPDAAAIIPSASARSRAPAGFQRGWRLKRGERAVAARQRKRAQRARKAAQRAEAAAAQRAAERAADGPAWTVPASAEEEDADGVSIRAARKQHEEASRLMMMEGFSREEITDMLPGPWDALEQRLDLLALAEESIQMRQERKRRARDEAVRIALAEDERYLAARGTPDGRAVYPMPEWADETPNCRVCGPRGLGRLAQAWACDACFEDFRSGVPNDYVRKKVAERAWDVAAGMGNLIGQRHLLPPRNPGTFRPRPEGGADVVRSSERGLGQSGEIVEGPDGIRGGLISDVRDFLRRKF